MTIVEIVVILLIVVMGLFLVFVPPYFEAQTYTRLTGKQVSYWDAVWLDLLIQEQVK